MESGERTDLVRFPEICGNTFFVDFDNVFGCILFRGMRIHDEEERNTMARHGCLGFVLSMTMAALLGCPASQAAAVAMWNVTSGADDPSNPAVGTFRYTVLNASPGDTVRFTGAGDRKSVV